MREDILDRKEEILEWININQSKAYICRELKCKPDTLNFWLKKMNIDYSGNMGAKGIKNDYKKMTALEYSNSLCVKSNDLKKKLIEEGYKEHKCEECNLIEWNGKLIPIELHHIDGDRFNNKFDNLQILCCNCHAQTKNWRGRGASNGVEKNKCIDCDGIILRLSTRCRECNIQNRWSKGKNKAKLYKVKVNKRKVERPTLEQLKKEIYEIGYSATGRKYGVSDNSIRAWIKFYEKSLNL